MLGVLSVEAEAVITEAGFKSEVEGGGLFRLETTPSLLAGEQDPGPGNAPKKTAVIPTGGFSCPDLGLETD